jgi:hypothetical protein
MSSDIDFFDGKIDIAIKARRAELTVWGKDILYPYPGGEESAVTVVLDNKEDIERMISTLQHILATMPLDDVAAGRYSEAHAAKSDQG